MDFSCVLFVGTWPSDDGSQNNERRFVGLLLSVLNRRIKFLEIFGVFSGFLPVNNLDVPPIRFVTLLNVFGKRNIGVIFDRNLVGVIDRNEVTELLMTSKGRSFRGDTFLKVPITSNDIHKMVKWAFSRNSIRVKKSSLEARGIRKAHSRSQTLAEWAGSNFNTFGVSIFGVTRGQRAPGA